MAPWNAHIKPSSAYQHLDTPGLTPRVELIPERQHYELFSRILAVILVLQKIAGLGLQVVS